MDASHSSHTSQIALNFCLVSRTRTGEEEEEGGEGTGEQEHVGFLNDIQQLQESLNQTNRGLEEWISCARTVAKEAHHSGDRPSLAEGAGMLEQSRRLVHRLAAMVLSRHQNRVQSALAGSAEEMRQPLGGCTNPIGAIARGRCNKELRSDQHAANWHHFCRLPRRVKNFFHYETPSFRRIFPTHHFDDTATKLDMAVSTRQQLENLERRLNIAVKFLQPDENPTTPPHAAVDRREAENIVVKYDPSIVVRVHEVFTAMDRIAAKLRPSKLLRCHNQDHEKG
ncbi:unnamed protein product [Mesocestoides corti]|uniref:Uncharacterized protein n=1 Tax=Mesocestoides corti TaxID=53468 RepID=A0A0R3U929_MESCO|nr:unnamed protein product [Mesocestoides corti]